MMNDGTNTPNTPNATNAQGAPDDYLDAPPAPETWILRADDIPEAWRPQAGAWAFLREEWTSGLFIVYRPFDAVGADAYRAFFADDGENIPLSDMAFSNEIGIFRPSQFPRYRDEMPAAIEAIPPTERPAR